MTFAPDFIDLDWSEYYWYDVACKESQARLFEFSAVTWAQLEASCKKQPEAWRERLAYVLGVGDAQREVPLLVRLVVDSSREVSLTARESLRCIEASTVLTVARSNPARCGLTIVAASELTSINDLLRSVYEAQGVPC
ncbi:MAG: hypothetical protein GY811_12425 [Myxococcales bacterium]|nr:hypothetical protein [Myxococcales bacterium]